MSIEKCNCRHEGQDLIHGKNMRVYNETNKVHIAKGKPHKIRCTVCRKEKGH